MAEDDITFDSHQWPGWPNPRTPVHADYSEGLHVGYRYYDAHGLEPAYPFGHGLSYTTFEYSSLAVDAAALTVSCTLRNVGARDGAEVAQLYLAYPPAAGEPAHLACCVASARCASLPARARPSPSSSRSTTSPSSR